MMSKAYIYLIVFLILLNSVLSIQADNITIDFRFDLGYIAFNESNNRGYGNYIASIDDSKTKRLGILLFDIQKPVITITSPINDYTDDNGVVDFKFIVNDDSNIKNCSVYFIEIDTLTSSSSISNNIENTITAYSIDERDSEYYNYYINCTDIYNLEGKSEQRRFRIIQSGSPLGGGGAGGGLMAVEIPGNITLEEVRKIAEKAAKEPTTWIILITAGLVIGYISYKEEIDERVRKRKEKIKGSNLAKKTKEKTDEFVNEGWTEK